MQVDPRSKFTYIGKHNFVSALIKKGGWQSEKVSMVAVYTAPLLCKLFFTSNLQTINNEIYCSQYCIVPIC